jgi:arginine deiminase
MAICVKSEIGKLKKVLIHRPGGELEHLTPDYLSTLLFDDIPYLKRAQLEHDSFAQTLRNCGVEVVYLCDLVTQALDTDVDVKKQFIREFLRNAGNRVLGREKELYKALLDTPSTKEMVLKTMQGVLDTGFDFKKSNPLLNLTRTKAGFLIDPIPNLYFTRDPMASIGTGASLNHMSSVTRNRETIYMKYVFDFHPDFKGKVKKYYNPLCPYSIEGGDIHNLSAETLAIGLSQRTCAEAIELLSQNIFADEESTIKNILAIDIPNTRAFMHLDTVLTQADKNVFIVHPGILDNLKVYRVFPGARGSIKAEAIKGSLEAIFCKYLELDSVKFIKCGGNSAIASEREQWNDGSNALCVEPGKVIVYDRNTITNSILRDNGLQTLEIASSELSRGRGGPRCMSMPLVRE